MQLKITGPGGDCSPKFSLPGIYDVSLPASLLVPIAGYNTNVSTMTRRHNPKSISQMSITASTP